MRYISIEDIEPGQYLGRTVYSANGTVLLSAGVQLTVFMINTLKRIGATMLYIKDPDFEDIEITMSVRTATACRGGSRATKSICSRESSRSPTCTTT